MGIPPLHTPPPIGRYCTRTVTSFCPASGEQVAAHFSLKNFPSSRASPSSLHRTAIEDVITGGLYSYTRMAVPLTEIDLPRLSITVACGVCTPLPLTGPPVPDAPSFVSPANRNWLLCSDAPPFIVAEMLYCTRLIPCTHSPQPCNTALSFTTVAVTAASGRTLSGTYSVNAALTLPIYVPPLYTLAVIVPLPDVALGIRVISPVGTVHWYTVRSALLLTACIAASSGVPVTPANV